MNMSASGTPRARLPAKLRSFRLFRNGLFFMRFPSVAPRRPAGCFFHFQYMGENGGLCRAPRGSIYGARGAPFDIIAALRRGNFDILPLRAIRDALALLARERGKGKRLSLFSSRSCATYRMIPGRDHISKAPKREVLFGAYIELRGSARNISSARHARIGSAPRRIALPHCCFLLFLWMI